MLLGDKVGGNIDMTGDGRIVVEKDILGGGCIAQIKVTKKKKHFTVIGLKNLLGEPIFSILIIEGKS